MKNALIMVASLGLALPALADTGVTVPGTSNPWLAGMPWGTQASFYDVAPDNSPVEVLADLSSSLLTFSAEGYVRNGTCCAWRDPDGGSFYTHYVGAEHGISDVNAPINSLVGVFLTAWSQAGETPAAMLDFGSIGLDFEYLAPEIGQVFFIGDGLTADGVRQVFAVPTGATRLFLGTMDGFSWNGNEGSFDVTVSAVPEPASWGLLVSGLGLIAAAARRRLAA